jgi:hypothetical protein
LGQQLPLVPLNGNPLPLDVKQYQIRLWDKTILQIYQNFQCIDMKSKEFRSTFITKYAMIKISTHILYILWNNIFGFKKNK